MEDDMNNEYDVRIHQIVRVEILVKVKAECEAQAKGIVQRELDDTSWSSHSYLDDSEELSRESISATIVGVALADPG